jgi:hypothetical protein
MLSGMKKLGVVGATFLALSTAACGSSDDDSAASAPTVSCNPQELKVSGTLDGTQVELVRATSGYAFVNKISASPGSADVTTPQGSLSLEFNKLVANGQSGPARGSFVDSEGALSIGNCETGDFVSTISMDAGGSAFHFTLRGLRHEPYCSGAAVVGELNGCVASSQ